MSFPFKIIRILYIFKVHNSSFIYYSSNKMIPFKNSSGINTNRFDIPITFSTYMDVLIFLMRFHGNDIISLLFFACDSVEINQSIKYVCAFIISHIEVRSLWRYRFAAGASYMMTISQYRFTILIQDSNTRNKRRTRVTQ